MSSTDASRQVVALYCELHRTLEPIQAWLDERNVDSLETYMALPIEPDSWLNEERFAEFKRAYEYASSQTLAIEPLSKLSPEETYYVFAALRRGYERRSYRA